MPLSSRSCSETLPPGETVCGRAGESSVPGSPLISSIVKGRDPLFVTTSVVSIGPLSTGRGAMSSDVGTIENVGDCRSIEMIADDE
jgi:hypothetical protein